MSDEPILVVPDTNVLLEYQPLDHHGWRELFDGRSITFMVVPPVIKELDNAKAARRIRLQKRARERLPWLQRHFRDGTPLANGARLEYWLLAPLPVLERGELDRGIPDDLILASAIHCHEAHSGHDLVFLTEDIGASLRAEGFGLRVATPPAELRLPQEPTEEEQELQQLRKDVESLRMGAPEITVDAGPEPVSVSVNPFCGSRDQWVTQTMEAERRDLGDVQSYGPEYEARVADYLRDLEAHTSSVYPLLRFALRGFRIPLKLFNKGGAPASDINILLDAPDHLLLMDELPEIPPKPKPPPRPGPFGIVVPDVPLFADLIRTPHAPLVDELANVGAWTVGPHNHARIRIANLTHGLDTELPTLFASFGGDVQNFHIDWTAHVGNVREPFRGRLNFVADESRTPDELERFLALAAGE